MGGDSAKLVAGKASVMTTIAVCPVYLFQCRTVQSYCPMYKESYMRHTSALTTCRTDTACVVLQTCKNYPYHVTWYVCVLICGS